ncbi:TolC family protein [Chitinophaga skermanii]|nr:TolC family protein [Chitinophaga skermanii]
MKLQTLPKIITVALMVLCMQKTSVAQEKWSFQRCVDYALAHNIDIRQVEMDKRLAALRLKQAKWAQVPSVSGSVNSSLNNGRNINPATNVAENLSFFSSNFSVSAGVELFSWFKIRNQIKSYKKMEELNLMLLNRAQNDMGFNIANAFLQIILASETVKVNESQVRQAQAQLENTKKLVAAGSVSEANQADLEAQLARDSSTLITSKNNLVTSVLQIKALLNLDFETPFEPEIPGEIKNLPMLTLDQVAPEMVFSAALANHPLAKADQMRIESSEYDLKAAKAAMLPTISLFAGISSAYNSTTQQRVYDGTTTEVPIGFIKTTPQTEVYTTTQNFSSSKTPFGTQFDNNFGQNIGATLRIPLLNNWQLRGQVEQTRVQLEKNRLTFEGDKLTLRKDVYTAYANAETALDKYRNAIRIEESSAKAYDFATKRYNVGLLSSIEYLTTQTNLFKAQTDKLYALYDYIFKVKLLEFYRDQKITL